VKVLQTKLGPAAAGVKVRVAVLFALALLTASLAAGAARAADGHQVLGSTCTATTDFPYTTTGPVVMIPTKSSTLSPVPSSGGMITSWRVNLGRGLATSEVRLSVLALVGHRNRIYNVIAQSPIEKVKPGLNVFKSELPIAAGENIALSTVGNSPLPVCETTPFGPDAVWFRANEAPLVQGDTGGHFHPSSEFQVPLEATVEEVLKGSKDR
jgi:hypothetical protein